MTDVTTTIAPSGNSPTGTDPTGLRDTIVAAMEEHKIPMDQEFKPSAPAVKTEDKAPAKTADATRDAAGKFQPKAGETTSTETKTPADEVDEAPATWTAQGKELWKQIATSNLTPEQQKAWKSEIRKREGDFKKGIIAKDEELKKIKPTFDALESVIGPRRAAWQQNGMNEQQALSQLLQYSDFAGKDPAGFVRWMAQTHGLDLSNLKQAVQDGTAPDPRYTALTQELHGFKTQLQQMQTGFAQNAENARAADIQAFIDEKGPDGNPSRPHFNDVYDDLRPLLPSIQAANPDWSVRQVIQKAYDNAVWINPEVRAKIMAAQSHKDQDDADATKRSEAAARAHKAAVASGAPNNLPKGAPDPTNLRAVLEHNYAQTMGSGAARLQ